MRVRGSRVGRFAQPLREWARRSALLLLLLAATALLVLGRTHAEATAQLRATIADLVAPILSTLAHPVAAARSGAEELRQLLFLRDEVARLKDDNARLMQWQNAARRLEQENAVLRAQLVARTEPRPILLTARVIGDSAGPFVRTLLLNAGRRDGVEKGQAAMAGQGLVGRVVEVGERSSRLLLLTDLNARVPVMLEASNIKGMLAGDNGPQPRLIFLSQGEVKPGDRVVTSGHDGLIPPGILVGSVVKGDGVSTVLPAADWSRIDYVQIVRFDLPRLDQEKKVEAAVANGEGNAPPPSASRRGRVTRTPN
jgi:rod shape-determining protein MreC